MSNILVFTDNLFVYENFVKIIEKKNLNLTHSFTYSCSPKNILFENTDDVTELNIKSNLNKLLSKFELIFSCHSKQLFPKLLVDSIRCINIHPGLNPYNRGWFPQVFSIINKLPLGVTIHEMDEHIDHGGIIVQKSIEIYDWDTSLSAYNRILEHEVDLLDKHIESLVSGDYNLIKVIQNGNYNSKKDFKALCELNMDEDIKVSCLIDKLRALSHGDFKNAYFINKKGEKIFVNLNLKKENSLK